MYTNLFIARRERKATQSEMASLLNIHKQSYYLKENRLRDFTITEAKTLSNYFGKSIDELFAD